MKIPKGSVLLIGALAFLTTACGGSFLSAAAAVVNGHRISTHDVDQQVDLTLKNQQPGAGAQDRDTIARNVLPSLIKQELLAQEAARRHISLTSAEIDVEVEKVKQSLGGQAAFDARVKQLGLSMTEVRKEVGAGVVVDRLLKRLAAPVTDADVRKQYELAKNQYRQIRVRHILFATDKRSAVKAKALADAALARIKAGESFIAVAKQSSEDPGSKASGGLLPGWSSLVDDQGQPLLDPSFAEAAWKAPIGRVVGPIRSQFGFHLIVTLQKRIEPLSAVGPRIKTSIEQNAGNQAVSTFLGSALAKANIVVNPRYGDWDAATATIVDHHAFVPAAPAVDANQGLGSGSGFIVPQPTVVPTQ